MKRAISVLLLISVLLFSSCGAKEEKNINMTEFKEHILATKEKIQELFTNDFENTVIGYIPQEGSIRDLEIYKYNGPHNQFSDVCEALADYCSPHAAELLIRDAQFYNVDGNLGTIAADGEVNFIEFQEENMQVLSSKDDTLEIKVEKFTIDWELSQDYIYTFEKNEKGKYIITDVKCPSKKAICPYNSVAVKK